MKSSEVKRFAALYERHLKLLKLQGKSKSTIDAYSRAVRRIRNHYGCCPDKLTQKQLENYFADLVLVPTIDGTKQGGYFQIELIY